MTTSNVAIVNIGEILKYEIC